MTQAENTQYFLSQPAQVRQDKTIAKHSSEEGKWAAAFKHNCYQPKSEMFEDER